VFGVVFPGCFGAHIKCQLWIIIYRREAPDVSFQMKVELHRLKLCSSSYCHFSPERSCWKTHQSIHGLRVVDPRICVDFHAYAWIIKDRDHA
ncbi:hypothetical protein PIB30_099679, partial [Stylosanthes scabra]|nr:hypothetical protein [Stylosanthes scabra]